MDFGCLTIPPTDKLEFVQDKAKFATDYPTVVAFSLFADLLFTPSFSDGMEQLYALCVGNAQNGRVEKKAVSKISVAFQKPKEPCSLIGKQGQKVSPKPPVKGSLCYALNGEQDTNGDDFTLIKVGLAVSFDILHRIIYPAEQLNDKIFSRHRHKGFSPCKGFFHKV